MAHKPFITVEDGSYDTRFIYVKDLTIYDEMLEIKNRRLQVLLPFADEYRIINFQQHQENALSSITLGINNYTSEELPDGVYKFHYSIAPNDKINFAISHYRVAILMNKVLGKMMDSSINCQPGIDECGNVIVTKYQTALLHIWMLLKGCQTLACNELLIPDAENMYKQAQRIFDKLYKSDNCKTC